MRVDESLLNRRDFLDGLMATGVVACAGVAGEAALGYVTGLEVPEPDQRSHFPQPLDRARHPSANLVEVQVLSSA